MTTDNPGMSKITVLIDSEVPRKIKKPLHLGQYTEVMRALLTSLADLMESPGGKDKVMTWLYVGGDLTLPKAKKD